jgi:hypothetical protein
MKNSMVVRSFHESHYTELFLILAEIFIGRSKTARVIQWKERVLVAREISVPEK